MDSIGLKKDTQKDLRQMINMCWQALKDVEGKEYLESDKGLYIQHKTASINEKDTNKPVVKIVLREHEEDPVAEVFIRDDKYRDWKPAIHREIEDEEMAARHGRKGKGKSKGEEAKSSEAHTLVQGTRTEVWRKSYKKPRVFRELYPAQWAQQEKEAKERLDWERSKGGGKGKAKSQKGTGKGKDKGKQWTY